LGLVQTQGSRFFIAEQAASAFLDEVGVGRVLEVFYVRYQVVAVCLEGGDLSLEAARFTGKLGMRGEPVATVDGVVNEIGRQAEAGCEQEPFGRKPTFVVASSHGVVPA
jgi:hypothetical protein